jgi:N-methylhydantoinase A/oxoprolinase/acetone carboxylase beta subunit
MNVGSQLQGPAIVQMREATVVVDPNWQGRVDQLGTLVLEKRFT